jgi:hypothetical protein
MSCVLPGLPEILAKFFLSVNILINDDLPTFDLPINAYSGKGSFGHLLTSELLIINSADLIFIFADIAFFVKLFNQVLDNSDYYQLTTIFKI